MVSASLSKITYLIIYGRVYFNAIHSVPLVCTSVFMPGPYCSDHCSFVICFEIRKCGKPTYVLLFQGCFRHLESLENPYKFQNEFFSISAKKSHWDFDRDCTASKDHLGSNNILIISLLIHELRMPFHLFVLSSISLAVFYSFQCTSLSLPWLSLL